MIIPNAVFLTKGVGVHNDKLMSFELALRDAGIEGCNLVPVSSIFPPNCMLIPKEEGIKKLMPGAITFCVWGRMQTATPNTRLCACTAIAIPNNSNVHGYIAEHTTTTMNEKVIQHYTENLATSMFETRYKNNDYQSMSIAIESIHENKRQWTTIVATAVFIES